MSCPTCDHTMQAIGDQVRVIGDQRDRTTFWCPRCGTIKNTSWVPDATCPELVPRVRELLDATEHDDFAWILGVTEAIWLPDNQRECAVLKEHRLTPSSES